MQVVLRIANGKSNVRQVRLQSDTTIGRSPDCQLKVASNQISRRHCQIAVRGILVLIKDLGSANGTFVNGRQIPPDVEIPLTPGTRVALGPLQFTIEYDLPGARQSLGGEHPETLITDHPTPRPGTAAQFVAASLGQSLPETEHLVQPGQFPLPGSPGPISTPYPANQVMAGGVVPQTTSNPHPFPPGTPGVIIQAPPNQPWDSPQHPVTTSSGTIPPNTLPPIGPYLDQANVDQFSGIPAGTPDWPAVPTAQIPVVPSIPQELSAPAVSPSALEDDEATFHFGIYAASGSGIIVESESTDALQIDPSTPGKSGTTESKPTKRGLFEMLGWGKKRAASTDAASPLPLPDANFVDPAAQPAGDPSEPISPVLFEETDAGAETEIEETAIEVDDQEQDTSEESGDDPLQNFFDQFQ